jgi:L-lactate dehydrogenase complex protein LldF
MKPHSHAFPEGAARGLANPTLQTALARMRAQLPASRAAAVANLPEFEPLRDEGRAIKDHVLAHLDFYLETFETRVREAGGVVHWCRTAEEARKTVIALCREAGAKRIIKGKSMISEEMGLNEALTEEGISPVETDLGEYIIQLRGEGPSHITAPAIHLAKEDVEATFRRAHQALDPARDLKAIESLVSEARLVLRDQYFATDVGITGANFLVAETGSVIVVTNEGNADLSQILPSTHIVLASIDKVVPTLKDAFVMLRLLARSATGQELTAYTTFATGPKRPGDLDGPRAFHVVLLDNGRTKLLGSEFQEILRCIRCGACMNHCPVYLSVGGHAYGWVYPGPLGAVLDPALVGLEETAHLPNASTFCGRCEDVCPVRIPLPKLMRAWRAKEWSLRLNPPVYRSGLKLWAFFAERPVLYDWTTALAARALRLFAGKRGSFSWLPFASSWMRERDFPVPEGATFRTLWRERGDER